MAETYANATHQTEAPGKATSRADGQAIPPAAEGASVSTDPQAGPACRRAGIAIWGAQGPLVEGEPFVVNVAVKSLDGLPLTGARIFVLDETGTPRATATPETTGGELSAETVVNLVSPRAAGPHSWRVILGVDGRRVGAGRPLPFSVTPRPTRPARIRVVDAATGRPLPEASAYLYHRNLAKVHPLRAESDVDGYARTTIAGGAPYNVRVECRGYHEGVCNLDAGDKATTAEGTVALEPRNRDEQALLAFGRQGPSAY